MKKHQMKRRPSSHVATRPRFTKLAFEPLEHRRLLTIFTVINVSDSGTGSLRDAINQANANPGGDTITFAIPGSGVHKITPLTGLPQIRDAVTIDGDLQPGYTGTPLIELDGSLAANASGLEFVVGGNVVNGLDIHSFQFDGILIAEQQTTGGGNNYINGNYIGTDPTGKIAEGNVAAGIQLISSPFDHIDDNLISGNNQSGIFVTDNFSAHTQITNNLIGTDVTGLAPLGNKINGIALAAPPTLPAGSGYASYITVGGLTSLDRNVIAGNGQAGVWIRGGTGNVVEGNYIGVGADGTTPLGNGAIANPSLAQYGTDGVYIDGGTSSVIGGTEDGAGNVISANANDGVRINATDIGATGNFVQGNYIGTDKSGEVSLFLGNHHDGIEINNNSTDTSVQVSHTTIGGADIDDGTVDGVVKARNIISGNTSFGIAVVGHRIDSTAILGNFIGTDGTGLLNDGNGQSGIFISSFAGEDPTSLGPSRTTIGDAESGSPNLISGNSVYGISISGGTSTKIERNLIGVDITESTTIANGFSGIDVLGPAGVTIGGLPQTVDGASVQLGNVIAGNANDGVLIQSGATGVQIVANYIGMSPVNNRLGNKHYGIDIRDSASNLIGGGGTAAANYIVNNGIDGVVITGKAATNNFVDGNDIGVLADGTADGNAIDGILIYNAPGNTIGGLIADTINVISSNGGAGVHVDGAFSTGNRIIGNYIGTDPTGTKTRGNSGGGVLISDAASGNFVGASGGGVHNVISGNLVAGIAVASSATSNTIVNNLIGTDLLGANPVPNVGMGISLVDAASNVIGGSGTNDGNTIEYTATDPDQDPTVESGHGISISGQAAIGNQVLNNNISGNATDGIRIGEGAKQNTIGDPTLATHNLISANLRAVSIENNSSSNAVIGNYLGTDENGNADAEVGNTLGGVALSDVTNNIIQGNTIRDNPIGVGIANAESTGNRVIGNTITNSSSEGVQVTRGASSNVIGGINTASRNVISANARGITIDTEAHGNSVIGNFIGTDANGDYDENMGNTIGGIAISQSADNTIQGNTVRGNPIGVGMAFADTTGNYLLGNTITQSSSEGVQIVQGASNNVIGGSSADSRNIISINQLGISITAGSNNNSVVGNYIGTDDDGNFSDGYGNSQDGLEILDSSTNSIDSNKIVGSVNGVDIENADTQGNTVAGNTITNNTQYAVALLNGTSGNIIGGSTAANANLLSMDPRGVSIESGSHDNQVIGNNIGTDPSGNFDAAYGDSSIGVGIIDSYANLVQDNTIRGNQFGVGIRNAPSVGNKVQGNIITNSTGYGVLLANGASNNLIGGADDGDGNQISQNGDAGVWADSGTGNAILHNNIFGNAGLGIDLAPAGVTPNDDPSLLDADSGPNNLQNFPMLIAATSGGSHEVAGTLSSAANTTYTLEFFNVMTPDSSGYGQGDQYLTTITVTTNASGIATFNATLPNSVAVGSYISATATDSAGNTSEFSKVVPVQQDSDGDGVGDDTENSGPAGGDANGDGIPDSQQTNVATFPDAVSGQNITLVAPAGTSFSNVATIANPSPSDSPGGVSFYQGFFSFTLSGVAPGASVAVEEILPAGSQPIDYYRYGAVPWDANPEWYEWADSGTGQLGADFNGNIVTLHFVDGQYGDDDSTANGVIVDPGGPAFQTRFTVTNTNDDGPGSLRQAINNANSHPGDDLIDFNIPGGGVHTIRVQSQLPFLNEAVTIDATTQPGYAGKPLIEVDGEDVSFSIGLAVFGSNVTIRGLDINRFSRLGIGLYQGSTYAAYNVDIEACYIGTDPTGTIAEGNGDGIDVFGGSGTIGGALAGQGNLISGNWGDGIHVYRDYGMTIVGNLIGTAADGVTPLGNAGDGVHLDLTNSEPYRAQYVTVGGLDPGDANVIAFNGQDGIDDTSSDNYGYGYNIVSYSAGNVFLSNSIYDNSRLGISHRYSKDFLHAAMISDSGQDVNDGASGGDGYSNPQNYPVLNSALSANGQTTITGHLDSAPDVTYWVQFFSSQQGTVTGYGQGQTYLGTATVTTDDNGHADFSVTLSVSVSKGQLIAATASTIGGGTSDFSQRIAVGDVLGNVFVVNSTDDTDDGAYNPAHVTLRDAILAADAHPGQDTIEFDIPGGGVQTIMPATALPLITDPVIIDGTSQPGYSGTPLMQISGANVEQTDVSGAPINEIGLFVDANDSTIRALNINSFSSGSNIGTGIVMEGSNNVLVGCFIGTDPTGTVAKPNTLGSLIIGENDRIGGTTAADRNLISGNVGGMAIGIFAIDTPNVIEGNFIGTDVTGSLAVPNMGFGLSVSGATIIGGTAPGAGNVISGNGGSGLGLSAGNGSIIQGNLIGTDVTGTKKLGNAADGMEINSQDGTDPGTIIGGTAPGARNIVSSNGGNGIVDGGFNDVIQGNLIGTDITGTLNFGNGYGGGSGAGIVVGWGHNLVGGPQSGAGNVISGNAGAGIEIIQAPPVPNTSTNMIQGNLIGTQIDGVSPLGNGADGIYLENGPAGRYYTGPQGPNVIGGLDPGDANTIAFNGADGVDLQYFITPFNYLEPVVQNILILSNAIYSNGKLGIDLGNDGVTSNDTGDADSGSNELQNFPALVAVGSNGVISTVTGTYNSTPNTYITLQFFLNAAADPSGHGEGQTILGTRYLTTDASGNATFSFNFSMPVAPGQFVSATASNPDGATSEFSNDVTWSTNAVAANQAPTVSVGGPYTINEGDSLSLDASHSNDPDGDPLTYTWDVNGDGVFGDVTGATPTLTWAQLNSLGIVNGPSTFNVSVRIADGQSHVVTSPATTLSVLNVVPVVDAGPDQYVNEDDTVSLTGTFTDPGTADTHTLAWHVDSDNGQAIADGSGTSFSFVPDDNGTYTVTFTVTDSDGGMGAAVVQVYVYDVSPVAQIVGLPQQSPVNVPITLSSTVTDVSPVDTAAGFSYYWQAYGEVSGDYFTGSDPTFSFTPTGTGAYDVELVVADKDGGNDYVFQTVMITGSGTANAPPVVTLPPNKTLNEGDTYTASGSFTDPDSTSWNGTVNYGDGTGVQPLTLNPDKTFALSHVYKDNGQYLVIVTVTDDGDQAGTQTTQALVNNVAPAVTLRTPTSVAVDAVFSLLGSFTDPGNDTWTATVNYGDGTGNQPLTLAADHTFALSHAYQSAGHYGVAVTVTDDDGGAGTANVTEVVTNVQTSLTAAAASATYGGATNLSATLLAGSHPISGKTLSFSINGQPVGTASTDGTGTATLTNVPLTALHAGTATISVSFAGDGINVASTGTASLTIGKAALTITADAKTKIYGAALPALTASYGGLVNGDTPARLTTAPTITTTATSASHVGSYSITATGAVDNDYTISYKAGTVSVTPAALTITADATTKVYGAVLPALTASYGGLVNGDTPASLTTAPTITTAATSASHVGSYSITATGAADNDYTISYKAGTLSVTPATLTITSDAKTKIYGAVLPALTASYGGLVNGDTPASLTTAPTLTTIATPTSHVGSYSITATGAGDNDYTIIYKAGMLSVTPAALTITADAKTKVYGAALPALTASYSGLVNGDMPASLTTAPTITTAATLASHVGSYSITATGAADNDYSITYKAGTLSVNPAALSITADTKTKVYGAALPALATSYGGLVNGDTPTSLTTAPTLTTTATSTSHVGSYPITTTGAVDTDYTITYQSGTLSVTPAALTITPDAKTKVYGAALPALTASYGGLVNGDTPASLTAAPALTTAATSASHVGAYSIAATGAVDTDYTITYKAAPLSVTPAALTITADNKTKAAGTANPALTFTPSGLVNGDTAASLTTQPTLTTTATTSSQAGTYAITGSGAADSDYTISYAAGTLTVTAVATGGSISGKDFLDVTGNGLTSDDTPMAGVKVYLDTNNNGVWNTGEPTATTLADGSYTFTGLAAGKYTVREVAPIGYIRTGPVTSDNYSVTLATGQTTSGDNFANAQLGNTSILCNVAYLINGTTAVADLRGATHEGDTIEVSFNIAAGTAPQRITLVSYNAPSATYDPNTAAQQTIFDSDTGVFGPGSYTLTVSNPHTYFQLDFVEGAAIDHLGANGSNIFYTNQNRLFSADNGGTDARRASPASLTGYAYLDTNNNGIFETSERPVAGVKVTVTGGSVTQSVVTDMYGAYTFDNLPAGTYTITETQPTGYSDGKDTLGNKGGTASNDKFTGITLTAGSAGAGYNFGELQTVGSTVAGNQTQTAAWWDGSSGQALIKAVNGSQTSKTLGNWLATNFNNLFGADAGSANNLAGKTNAQVATFYQSLYGNTSKRPEVDTLALALNMYVTNSSLAGNTAASYGFAVSTNGLAAATFNVATNGAAFGIADNTVMTIGELLARANARSRKGMLWDSDGNGTLNSSESVLRSQADSMFTTVNNV